MISVSCYDDDGGVSNPPPCELCPAGGGGSGGGTSTIPIPEEEDLIVINVADCIFQVYTTLKNNEGPKLHNVLTKLNEVIIENKGLSLDPRLQYNWKVQMGTCSNPNGNACTSGASGGVVTTTISDNRYKNASDLSIARTLIHEAFHAYLTFEYSYSSFTSTEYGDLVTEFAKDYSGSLNNAEQHKFFVEEKIINHIAEALYDFALNEGIPVDFAYCKKMSWAGLEETALFNTLSNQEEIKNIIRAEFDTRYTFGGYSNKGNTPCK